MSVEAMLLDGVSIMLLGMSIVFSFLIVLVISITVVAKIIAVSGVDEEKQSDKTAGQTVKNKSIIAAITAAVKMHREQGK